ncbi:uncharacterized protein LOC131641093 [Vicia villosa]|uniref:uncharacterized protein LOC131641093 n=1 Tax=Vicia villosa TaxID=3911 RepID=UPI00273C36C6|nr:uncharacterized protein LOC131641093 [Vicia villosa]
MFWNCRGVASKAFYMYYKHYTNNYKPSVLIIVKTRCGPGKLENSFKKLGFDAMVASDNTGYAEAIVIAWKTKEINVQVSVKDRQFIHVKVYMEHGKDWWCTTLYASPHNSSKNLVWEELKKLADDMEEPWLIMGDFNNIAKRSEKKGGLTASMTICQRMKNRMDDCKVTDMETHGPKFTWRGPIFHGSQRIYEKLDRGLSNDDWNFQFPEAYIKVLLRVDFSDHILNKPYGDHFLTQKWPFRFESAWILNETYNSMLQEAWQEEQSILVNLENVTRGIDKWKLETIRVACEGYKSRFKWSLLIF